MGSAEVEFEFEVGARTDKGNTYYRTVVVEAECGGEWEYALGWCVGFEVDDSDYEDVLAKLTEDYIGDPLSISDCEDRMFEDEIMEDEDEHIIELFQPEPIEHDFEIFREDNSFDYCDSGHTTCSDYEISGFKIQTFGSEVWVYKLEGYGIFENIRKVHKINDYKSFKRFFESLTSFLPCDNIEYIADTDAMKKFIETYLKS